MQAQCSILRVAVGLLLAPSTCTCTGERGAPMATGGTVPIGQFFRSEHEEVPFGCVAEPASKKMVPGQWPPIRQGTCCVVTERGSNS